MVTELEAFDQMPKATQRRYIALLEENILKHMNNGEILLNEGDMENSANHYKNADELISSLKNLLSPVMFRDLMDRL